MIQNFLEVCSLKTIPFRRYFAGCFFNIEIAVIFEGNANVPVGLQPLHAVSHHHCLEVTMLAPSGSTDNDWLKVETLSPSCCPPCHYLFLAMICHMAGWHMQGYSSMCSVLSGLLSLGVSAAEWREVGGHRAHGVCWAIGKEQCLTEMSSGCNAGAMACSPSVTCLSASPALPPAVSLAFFH